MYNTVAFIPLRGGSKSIPNKNVKLIAGKPLAFWTIEAAAKCHYIDFVYVATDSEVIASLVKGMNNPKVVAISRSAESATDTAQTEIALLEFCQQYQFDNVFLVQATSPLLKSEDLSAAFEKFKIDGIDSVLSVVNQKRFIWNKKDVVAQPANYDFTNRPRRQEFEGFYVENGAFYLSKRMNVLESKNRISGNISLQEMDEDSYYEIDEPSDWVIVENLLLQKLAKKSYGTNEAKLSGIQLFATDVDGVLTDAGMYYTETGDEIKKFNTRDGKGFELLRSNNIKTAIVTTENTKIVAKRAAKLKIDYLFQGCTDKVDTITQLSELSGVPLENIAFIGDDINDLDALQIVGFSATPSNGCQANKNVVDYICETKGGEGCVREVCELILSSKNNA